MLLRLPHLPEYVLPLFCRVLATLLCSVFIVTPSIARFGGKKPNLILFFKESTYFPNVGLGKQIEMMVLALTGTLYGLCISSLALVASHGIALKYGTDCIGSRTIVAVVFILHSFTCSYVMSKWPRLQKAAQQALYCTIFELLVDVGSKKWTKDTFTALGFCALCAAGLSLIASVPLMFQRGSPLAKSVMKALETAGDLLKLSTQQTLDRTTESESCKQEMDTLASSLFKQGLGVRADFLQTMFELRISRLNGEPLKGFVAAVEKLREEIALALPVFTAVPEELDGSNRIFLDTVDPPARALVDEILAALQMCQQTIGQAYEVPPPESTAQFNVQPENCLTARSSLLQASNALRTEITRSLPKVVESGAEKTNAQDALDHIFNREMFSICLFLSSLLEISSEVWIVLRQAEELLKLHLTSRRHLQIPHLSWEYLGIGDQISMSNNSELAMKDDAHDHDHHDHGEHEKVEAEKVLDEQTTSVTSGNPGRFPYLNRLWLRFSASTLRTRLKVSKIIRAISHSRHVKYAIRASLGGFLLALPVFLPKGSPSRKWFEDKDQGKMMVIGFVMGLDADVGGQLRRTFGKITWTILAVIYCFLAQLICNNNQPGIVAMVTASQVLFGWLILASSQSAAGMVGAITMSMTMFKPFKGPSSFGTDFAKKGKNLVIGLAAAMVAHHLIFPYRARAAFMTQIAKSIDQLCHDYITLSRPFLRTGSVPGDFRRAGMDIEGKVKSRLGFADRLLDDMNLEPSLLPKPILVYRKIETDLRRVLDLFVGLRFLRQNLPVTGPLRDVLDSRMHLVSSQIMVMFALSHCYRAQMPIPQFLPSSQHALEELISNLKERFNGEEEKGSGSRSSNVASMFSLAESEVMAEISERLDDLIQVTQTLFGTVVWWEGQAPTSAWLNPKKHYMHKVWRDVTHLKSIKEE